MSDREKQDWFRRLSYTIPGFALDYFRNNIYPEYRDLPELDSFLINYCQKCIVDGLREKNEENKEVLLSAIDICFEQFDTKDKLEHCLSYIVPKLTQLGFLNEAEETLMMNSDHLSLKYSWYVYYDFAMASEDPLKISSYLERLKSALASMDQGEKAKPHLIRIIKRFPTIDHYFNLEGVTNVDEHENTKLIIIIDRIISNIKFNPDLKEETSILRKIFTKMNTRLSMMHPDIRDSLINYITEVDNHLNEMLKVFIDNEFNKYNEYTVWEESEERVKEFLGKEETEIFNNLVEFDDKSHSKLLIMVPKRIDPSIEDPKVSNKLAKVMESLKTAEWVWKNHEEIQRRNSINISNGDYSFLLVGYFKAVEILLCKKLLLLLDAKSSKSREEVNNFINMSLGNLKYEIYRPSYRDKGRRMPETYTTGLLKVDNLVNARNLFKQLGKWTNKSRNCLLHKNKLDNFQKAIDIRSTCKDLIITLMKDLRDI